MRTRKITYAVCLSSGLPMDPSLAADLSPLVYVLQWKQQELDDKTECTNSFTKYSFVAAYYDGAKPLCKPAFPFIFDGYLNTSADWRCCPPQICVPSSL